MATHLLSMLFSHKGWSWESGQGNASAHSQMTRGSILDDGTEPSPMASISQVTWRAGGFIWWLSHRFQMDFVGLEKSHGDHQVFPMTILMGVAYPRNRPPEERLSQKVDSD